MNDERKIKYVFMCLSTGRFYSPRDGIIDPDSWSGDSLDKASYFQSKEAVLGNSLSFEDHLEKVLVCAIVFYPTIIDTFLGDNLSSMREEAGIVEDGL